MNSFQMRYSTTNTNFDQQSVRLQNSSKHNTMDSFNGKGRTCETRRSIIHLSIPTYRYFAFETSLCDVRETISGENITLSKSNHVQCNQLRPVKTCHFRHSTTHTISDLFCFAKTINAPVLGTPRITLTPSSFVSLMLFPGTVADFADRAIG